MKIRTATSKDFKALYGLGLETPEIQTSSVEKFMEEDEFLASIENPKGVFLLAEEKEEVAGFIYANCNDIERSFRYEIACLVYILVRPEHRGKGIVQELYDSCIKELKKLGIEYLYIWANAENDNNIVKFMERNGFKKGHKYLWMDRDI